MQATSPVFISKIFSQHSYENIKIHLSKKKLMTKFCFLSGFVNFFIIAQFLAAPLLS